MLGRHANFSVYLNADGGRRCVFIHGLHVERRGRCNALQRSADARLEEDRNPGQGIDVIFHCESKHAEHGSAAGYRSASASRAREIHVVRCGRSSERRDAAQRAVCSGRSPSGPRTVTRAQHRDLSGWSEDFFVGRRIHDVSAVSRRAHPFCSGDSRRWLNGVSVDVDVSCSPGFRESAVESEQPESAEASARPTLRFRRLVLSEEALRVR